MICRTILWTHHAITYLLVKTGKYTKINKHSDVKFWLNWMNYGAVSYSLSCTKVENSWGLTILICIYCWQSRAVTDAMAELRSENMIELVAIDLGVIITYGSCLEFAEQCYQKSLIFPSQNRKFIKWLNIELYIGIGQKSHRNLVNLRSENMIEMEAIDLEVIITYVLCLDS